VLKPAKTRKECVFSPFFSLCSSWKQHLKILSSSTMGKDRTPEQQQQAAAPVVLANQLNKKACFFSPRQASSNSRNWGNIKLHTESTALIHSV
jgi:hypothetical protein